MKQASQCRLILVWLALVADGAAGAVDYLSQAQRLLGDNQHRQAYEFLSASENEALGEAAYDRMLAEAAAGIGAYDEATLALERLLQLDPNAVDARIELAQNYFSLGNYEQAKFQLEKTIGETTNTGLLQQARLELTLVEEKLAKRRKRPVFDPNAVSQIKTAQRPGDVQDTRPAPINPALDIAIPMAEAQSLLRSGRPLDAYEALVKWEYDGAGNVEFDYLLGVAALEAGKPDKATLSLERVLASDSNYAGARIDMGRAYIALGDTARAQEEFAAVLAMNPPDIVRKRVEGFLAEIGQRTSIKSTHWSGFFGLTVGRDSNVNNAPNNAEQFIPGIPNPVVLDSDSVEAASNYLGLAGRIQVDHRINKQVGVYVGLDLNLRRNFQTPQFDSSSGELRVGGTFTISNHELEFSVAAGKTYLDTKKSIGSNAFLEHPLYRNLVGGTAQWRFNPDGRNQLQTMLQYNRLRYPDETIGVFDSDQTIFGLNWFRAFGASDQGLGFVGAYVGEESDIRGNPSGQKEFFGVRVGGQYSLTPVWLIFATAGAQSADYQRFQVIHQKTRDDKRYDLSIGMSYTLWQSWSLRPLLNLTRQSSGIGLFEFNRRELAVTLRRDWR